MPRPNLNANRPGVSGAGQFQNPIANWLKNRKDRRTQIENEAARMITNKIAENEQTIIDTLSSIDFHGSKLPKEVLERKIKPEHPCGELEYNTKAIISKLRKNPQTIKTDIRKIDEKILALVLLFKQAVELGDVETAHAAKAAVARAISEIRCRIPDPKAQPGLSKQFVEANTSYLDQLITLVLHAQQADRAQENVNQQRKALEKAEAKHEKAINHMKEVILTDPIRNAAFEALSTRSHTHDRASWSKEEREMHTFLVEQRMEQVNLDLKRQLLQQEETALTVTRGKMDILFTHASHMQIPTDPDLLNKFHDSVNDLFRVMAENDTQIEDALKSIAYVEGQIAAYNTAPGFELSLDDAARAGERLLDELKKQQEMETGEAALRQKKFVNKWGLLTDEQIAERKKENEKLLKEWEEEQVKEQQEAFVNELEEEKLEAHEPERLLN